MEKYIRNTPINVNGVRNKVKNHPDYIKRLKLIKAFMKDDNFKREEIQNHSVPLEEVKSNSFGIYMILSEISSLKIFYFEGKMRERLFKMNILLAETSCFN